MKRRNLYQSKHPFDPFAFEAFCNGSWETVELIRIEEGTMTLVFEDGGFDTAKRAPFSNLRLRSRKAAPSDCTCFLRPGVDICALSTTQQKGSSNEKHESVWIDAKISSIERKPHDNGCKCQYYVNFHISDEPLSSDKSTLSKDDSILQLHHISILQKLERNPCESEHFRWNFSLDCSSVPKTKLLLGKFLSDMTWLLVVSALRHVAFDVRSIQNKIVYQIVGSGLEYSAITEKELNAINFGLDNGVSISTVVPFAPSEISQTDISIHEICEEETLSFYDVMDLRRSKRRYVQPDRFLSEGSLVEAADVCLNGTLTYTLKSGELPLVPVTSSEDIANESMRVQSCKLDSSENAGSKRARVQSLKLDSSENHGSTRVQSLKLDSSENHFMYKSDVTSREVPISLEWPDHDDRLAIVPVLDPIVQEEEYFHAEFSRNHSEEMDGTISSYICMSDSPKVHTNNKYVSESTRSGSKNKIKRRRDFVKSSKRGNFYEVETSKRKSLHAGRYNEMIRKYMMNITCTREKEEPNIIEQWKDFRSMAGLNPIQRQPNFKPSVQDEEEVSENEMLWQEMELAIATSYISEENEGLNIEASTGSVQKSSKGSLQVCQHDYRLDEQIGIVCLICGYVRVEIRDVLPSFMPPTIKSSKRYFLEEDSENNAEDESLVPFGNYSATRSESSLSKGSDNVWALIPDFESKLLLHQRKAYEFLWQNIAGSLEPAHMELAAKKRGGCVISHAPGAGKTLLIIAFLVSYLKLFPGNRPLVLAPKTTLYTWYQEIKKWKVPIPVYQVHGCRTYSYQSSNFRMDNYKGDTKPGRDVMHVIDCLEKIRMWHSHPSVLLMGYTSFLSLTREDKIAPHRRYMSEVLRESPGILILDEGHNPRSTKSRLRKALMKVKTDLRVLLSGTLFQNNFGEYFNTLCLARPSFIKEVLRELDPNFKRKKKKGLKQTQFAIENRARKFFIENIASKINSSDADDRIDGLNLLRTMTGGFIDVYEGGSSDNLPGLHCYTLLMKPTTMQHDILVKLQDKMDECNGYPLELELLITLGSIHPWLIKTATCVLKFFNEEEVEALEKHKFELNKGSKVKFVVSLVHRSMLKKEKVLIFCHNIAPINLFLEIFGWLYGWRRNEEILVLQGDLELFERGRVIDKFEDPSGSSRILLASISACAEGVSLTAASRVILLDTEWNPSKRKQAIARAFRPGQERMVFVYQLLITGTLEEDKYGRTNYKEWVSSLIFSDELMEDPSCCKAEKIEDDLLREIVEEDRAKSFHMIMKNEKASNSINKGKECLS